MRSRGGGRGRDKKEEEGKSNCTKHVQSKTSVRKSKRITFHSTQEEEGVWLMEGGCYAAQQEVLTFCTKGRFFLTFPTFPGVAGSRKGECQLTFHFGIAT